MADALVECRFCGESLLRRLFPDKTCHACWEVTHRLDDVLNTPKLKVFVEEYLKKGGKKT